MMATTIETTTRPQTANAAAPELEESQRRYVRPPADILEGEQGWLIKVDLPGVTRESIELLVEKDVLTVRADRDAERGYMRSFGIPKEVDLKTVGAAHEDGVLTLDLPKVPASKPMTIEVK